MSGQSEIYPMPMFPSLSVTDVAASVDWYVNMLGFVSVFNLPAPNGGFAMAHLRWRKYADLLIVPDVDSNQTAHLKGVGVSLSFLVDRTNVDDMATDLLGKGIALSEGPVTRPWNTREIIVTDPDGYKLIFFEPVDTTRTFEDVAGAIKADGAALKPSQTKPGPH